MTPFQLLYPTYHYTTFQTNPKTSDSKSECFKRACFCKIQYRKKIQQFLLVWKSMRGSVIFEISVCIAVIVYLILLVKKAIVVVCLITFQSMFYRSFFFLLFWCFCSHTHFLSECFVNRYTYSLLKYDCTVLNPFYLLDTSPIMYRTLM